MNPYLANPDDIPDSDSYADVVCYGRYRPRPDDFLVSPEHINSQSAESLRYWSTVLRLCNESNRICPSIDGTREVFALGSVIIKSNHLLQLDDGQRQAAEIDFSYADANEVQAITLAKRVLTNVRTPEIYFAGKVNGHQTLVQERLPGVTLNVAWPYLSQGQKEDFKEQARTILRQLHKIEPPETLVAGKRRSHVVQDPNIVARLGDDEVEIMFSDVEGNDDQAMNFVHNDLSESNIIVDDDRIVGVIDWEMAGFFGWEIAGKVHSLIRTPQREHFANGNLSEERLRDIMFWNDLYEDGRR